MRPAHGTMTESEIAQFLTKEVTGRLVLAHNNEPYLVPLSYVFMNDKIYIHWFTEDGKKAMILKQNPKVCFEVDTYSQDHLDRASVLLFGHAKKVQDEREIKSFLLALAAKYPSFAPGKIGNHPNAVKAFLTMGMPFMIKKITVYSIEPKCITTKKWSRDKQ